MNPLVFGLLVVLGIWSLACAWCGYKARFVLFLGVLLGGLALNMAWMVFGLNASPFEHHALVAEASASFFAGGAFCVGWFAGRITRVWRSSVVS